jgi:hypothetical protein
MTSRYITLISDDDANNNLILDSTVVLTGDFRIRCKFFMPTGGSSLSSLWGNGSSTDTFMGVANTGGVTCRVEGGNQVSTGIGHFSLDEFHVLQAERISGVLSVTVDTAQVVSGTGKTGNVEIDYLGGWNVANTSLSGYITDFDIWDAGTHIHSWALDSDGTTSTETDSVGTNDVTRTDITSADTELFTLNEAVYPPQWENPGVTITLPAVYPFDVTAPAGGYNVIAIFGQSNASGQPLLRDGTDNDYSGIGGAHQYGYSYQGLIEARNPLDHVTNPAGTTGFWFGAINELVTNGSFSKPVLFVPAAEGGTSIADWTKGQSRYDESVQRLIDAMATHPSNTLSGVFWHQGEADAANATYQTQIEQTHTDMVADVTKMTSSTPWIVGEIKTPTQSNSDAINAKLLAFSDGLENSDFVTTQDQTLFDTVHFDPASLETIGTRYATALEPFIESAILSTSGITRALTRTLTRSLTRQV